LEEGFGDSPIWPTLGGAPILGFNGEIGGRIKRVFHKGQIFKRANWGGFAPKGGVRTQNFG